MEQRPMTDRPPVSGEPRPEYNVAETKDFLAELIEDSTAEDSLFPALHRARLRAEQEGEGR